MRRVTAVAVLVVLLALTGVTAVGLGFVGDAGGDLSLDVRWVSDTGRDVDANHHALAVATVDGEPMVFAPVSGRRGSTGCGLFALHANGTRAWSHAVPASNCTIHAVADPTTADIDGDGDTEVLTATTDRALFALDASTGDVERRYGLASYGYTRPVVADVTGDGATEIVVVDAIGTVSVLEPDGDVVWSHELDTFTWGQPVVRDFDGDGDPEIAVGVGGRGGLLVFEADGTVAWERTGDLGGGITWTTTGQTDDDPAVEIAVATTGGTVLLVDGATGETVWRTDLGDFAAIHPLVDGDGDGEPELYATARDGRLRAMDASTGDVEWVTTLTTSDVQMTPPPAIGDVDGDGAIDLVAVTNDGRVVVVDPATGEVRASYARENPIYTHPTLADLDGDGRDEILVMYGDGRVVVLDVTG